MEDPKFQAEVVRRGNDFGGIGQGAVAITPVQLMRAVGAISMVAACGTACDRSDKLANGFVETTHYTK